MAVTHVTPFPVIPDRARARDGDKQNKRHMRHTLAAGLLFDAARAASPALKHLAGMVWLE
jgi:hypothetical protein